MRSISVFMLFVLFMVSQVLPQTTVDSMIYGDTPEELAPYSRFEKPYKRFFIDPLEYNGYGRHLPEPKDLDTVYIGFVGPIVDIGEDSIGELQPGMLRVNQRVVRWDGYQASHLAPIGKKMLQGSKLAIEQANQRGGYRSRMPYHLIVRNDNGNWRSSGRELIHLAYKDRVWGVLGTIDGANSHIAIRAALKAEIPVMNTADTDPTFVETNIPWVFRCITDDRQMSYLLSDFVFKKLKLRRIAALRAINRYGRMNIDEFRDSATRLGYPFIIELQYTEGDTDFSKQLIRIQALRADGVITYGNMRESALIVKQMRELGMNQWFFGSDRIVGSEFIREVGPEAGKIAAAYPFDPTSDDALFLQFKEDFYSRFGDLPEAYAAHAYDGMNMLIQAIETAGLNRALIRDELQRMSEYKGVTGTKIFDAVYTNRSPAIITILENGQFRFYNQQEIFSEEF